MNFHWWHIIIVLLPMAPTFWSIWDIWTHSFASYQKRVTWLIIVIFIPVIGGIIYLIFGWKQARLNN